MRPAPNPSKGRRSTLQQLLPDGAGLDDQLWNRRHEFIVKLLWLHIPVVAALGLIGDQGIHTGWAALTPGISG